MNIEEFREVYRNVGIAADHATLASDALIAAGCQEPEIDKAARALSGQRSRMYSALDWMERLGRSPSFDSSIPPSAQLREGD